MVSLLTETLIKAGIRQLRHLMENQTTGKSRNEIPLAHGFRKFFHTALMNADVNPSFKKLLMGHSVQLDEVYYDKGSDTSRSKSRAKLPEQYRKAIDALTINEENRLRKKAEKEWKAELRFSMDCRKRDLAEAQKLNEKVKQNTEQFNQIAEQIKLLKKISLKWRTN